MSDCIKCIHYPICSDFRKFMFKGHAEVCGENFEVEAHDKQIEARVVEVLEQMKGESEMCDNECISTGKCEHNEECHDDVCFTSEQSKVVEKLIAKAKESERTKTIEEFKEKMKELNQLNCFMDYITDEIDLEELMHYASEEIAELLKKQK